MESVTALGLEWNLMADDLKLCFVFACKKNSVITHRVVLSFASSVFDPLVFASSFTIRIRLILRLIWQKALKSWEEQIPKDNETISRMAARSSCFESCQSIDTMFGRRAAMFEYTCLQMLLKWDFASLPT